MLQPAYNDHKWLSHFYLDGIRWHWGETHKKKSECQQSIRTLFSLLRNWFNLPIRVFHSDNKPSIGNDTLNYLLEQGVIVQRAVVGTPEQNGFAERSGGVIIARARALLQESGLPKTLWPEEVQAAIYILNRSPTKLNSAPLTKPNSGSWIIPQQEFHQQGTGTFVPVNLSNLRVYGCRTYVRIQGIPQSDKMHRRAEIGYLVGYRASNIWKVWFPRTDSCRYIRDATFDENLTYRMHPSEPPKIKQIDIADAEVIEEDELDAELEKAIQQAGAA
jgi:hypothetical protein